MALIFLLLIDYLVEVYRMEESGICWLIIGAEAILNMRTLGKAKILKNIFLFLERTKKAII